MASRYVLIPLTADIYIDRVILQMLEKAPQAQALLELSKDKSDEATKLAKETWGEILKVLEDKGKKARALVKEAKEKSK